MIEKKVNGIWVAEFKSIREFEEFITETPEPSFIRFPFHLH